MPRRYIRFWATTDESDAGLIAIDYLRSLMRIAPVRLCSMSNMLYGRWAGYAALMSTDMQGELVNVVCCSPDRWTWVTRVAAPPRDIAASPPPPGAVEAPPEILTARHELHTASAARNVLIAMAQASGHHEVETAMKYDVVVTPTSELASFWTGLRDRHVSSARPVVRLVEVPVLLHSVLAGCVMPA